MGRFVIVPDFHNDKTWRQRKEEHLDLRYLIFTSNLDGDIESYLDELCEQLAPEAAQIWGRCVGCPENPKGQPLKHYLKHNQINTGIFYAAYQDATVAARQALPLRARADDRVRGRLAGPRARGAAAGVPAGVRGRRLMAGPTPPVRMDLGDIQGDILRAYGNDYDHTTYAFVHIDCPPEQARAWFSGVVDHVTTAEPWPKGEKPLTTLNVSVTAAGLRALGVSEAVIGTFSKEFRNGMASRSVLLGDVGPSDPASWEPGLGTGDAHVLLTINARRRRTTSARWARCATRWTTPAAITIVYQEDTELLPGSREHFGYADGFAQPAVEGSSDDRARGGGVPVKGGGWRALAPGEFVLGYPDEDTRVDPKRRLPNAPGRPARAQRHVHGLAQALPGRRALPARHRARPRSSTRPATSTCSRRRSSGAGPTARRSSKYPTKPPEGLRRRSPRAPTTFATTRTSTGCAARSARTCAAPTRATRSARSRDRPARSPASTAT